MMIKQLFKRLTDTDKFNEASIQLVEGSGALGEKRPPFDQRLAVNSFHSWVHAAASINAFACAATPLRLYVRSKGGTKLYDTKKVPLHRKQYMLGDGPGMAAPSSRTIRKLMEMGDDFEEVTDPHPIIDLLHNVNPFYNGFDLTAMRILYGELTGNAYMAAIYNEQLGVPDQLWPMPSQWTQVIPDRKEFVKGYAYGQPGNQILEFDKSEVIHFRRPNPKDLFYGMGKVEAAWGTIGINEAIHEMDSATYRNHARPDYAVIVNGPSGETTLNRFEEHVAQKLQGTRKAGRFLAMTGDVQLTPLNFPPKDLSGREEVVEEIAAVFGVPVTLLKANDPNLASATAGYGQWREGTILPLLRMDEDELNQSLIPMFGLEGEAVLCYDSPVPRDEQFNLTKTQAAVSGGWMTINEARLAEGREPYDDELADTPLINGQPLGATAAPAGGLGLMSMEEVEESEPVEVEQQSAEKEPSVETTSLTGPQIASMLKIAEAVSSGSLSAGAAEGLLEAAGIDSDRASKIVQAQYGYSKPEEEEEKDAIEDDDGLGEVYATREEAEAAAERLGCSGSHEHELRGETVYMPCDKMEDYTELTGESHDKAIDDVDLQPSSEMASLAERGLKLREEHGRGGTEVGVARARNIKNRDNLSPETVNRMHSFFSRHRVDLDAPAANPSHEDYPSAGVIAWLLWGGDPNDPSGAGAGWAERKLEELERAEEKAPAKPSERIEGSDRNPEGSASGSRGGIEISDEQEKALKKKVEEHNEKHGDKKGKKVDLGMLKAVYRRGAGAFSTSHRPGMTRQQWSMARVNAFLYLVRNGKPESSKYVTDNDLLPAGHPKKEDKKEKNYECSCKNHTGHTKSSDLIFNKVPPEDIYMPWVMKDFKPVDNMTNKEQFIERGVQFSKQLNTVLRRAVNDVVSDLEKRKDLTKKEAKNLVADAMGEKFAKELQKTSKKPLSSSLGDGIKLGAKQLKLMNAAPGVEVDKQTRNKLAEITEAETIKFSDKIKKHYNVRVAKVLGDGIQKGETIPQLTKRVQDWAGKANDTKRGTRAHATMIARTETARAAIRGQVAAYEESGVVKGKKWLLAAGGCVYCTAFAKQFGKAELGKPFVEKGTTLQTNSGTMTLDYENIEGPPLHPNCRCGLIADLGV